MLRIDGGEESLEGMVLSELSQCIECLESDVVAGMISDEVGERGREFGIGERGCGTDGGDEGCLLIASERVGDERAAGVVADAAKIFEDLGMLFGWGDLELIEEVTRIVVE